MPPQTHQEYLFDHGKVRPRVAVIGSGLAGLTAAHLLASLQHEGTIDGESAFEIHLFEKAGRLGMDAASSSVICPCLGCSKDAGREGIPHHEHIEGRMDVPMRSFFPEHYPNLVRLYKSVGIQFHDAENTLASFDVRIQDVNAQQGERGGGDSCATSGPAPNAQLFHFSTRPYQVTKDHTVNLLDLPPFSITRPKPFFQGILSGYRIARDYLRMLIVSKQFMRTGRMVEIGKHPEDWGNGQLLTLKEFLKREKYSEDFCKFFVPIFASICTCSFEKLMDFPACVLLEYVARCMPFGRMQFVSSGIQQVVERLSSNVEHIHCWTAIESVSVSRDRSVTDGVKLVLRDSNGNQHTFDHVIFATQGNQAARALEQSSETVDSTPLAMRNDTSFASRPERSRNPFASQVHVLKRFVYESTQVVCHTDTSFLPPNPRHWRTLNIAKSSQADILSRNDHPHQTAMATHIMNHTSQEMGSTTKFLQTTNPIFQPDPAKVLSSAQFERAVVTPSSFYAVDDLDRVQGRNNAWFVGSYAYPGIPLLEGCVASSMQVVSRIVALYGGNFTSSKKNHVLFGPRRSEEQLLARKKGLSYEYFRFAWMDRWDNGDDDDDEGNYRDGYGSTTRTGRQINVFVQIVFMLVLYLVGLCKLGFVSFMEYFGVPSAPQS